MHVKIYDLIWEIFTFYLQQCYFWRWFLFWSKFVTLSVLNFVVTSIWNQNVFVHVNTDKFLCEHLFLSISLCSKVNRKVTCFNPRDWKYTTWDALWDATSRTWSKFLPPTTKLGARLCFYTSLWFCSSGGGGGGIPACLAHGIPACLAAGLERGGGGIPACIAAFQTHTKGGSWGVWLGGLQAHTWGVSRPTPREVYPSMHWGRPPTATAAAVRILLECILVQS